VLHYEAGLEGRWDLAVLQQRCEAELDDLTERFGFPLRRRLVVFLFANWKDISKVFGPQYVGTALVEANAVVLADHADIRVSLRHELTHLFAARWNRRAPPLLEEGLATWLPGTKWGRPVDWLVGQLLSDSEPVLPDLLRREFFFSSRYRSACYILAGSFTGFLIRRFGWDRYRTLYRKAGPVRFAATFKRVCGLTLEEAEGFAPKSPEVGGKGGIQTRLEAGVGRQWEESPVSDPLAGV
jgi:hypothetical protein